jgi:hypothetical protein
MDWIDLAQYRGQWRGPQYFGDGIPALNNIRQVSTVTPFRDLKG